MSAVLLVSGAILWSGCGSGADMNQDEDNKPVISNDVVYGASDYTKIVTANNDLGFKLLSEVEPNDDDNTFISPTSLLMALSMVYNGADGTTKEEIAQVLQSDGIDHHALNEANASLLAAIHKSDDNMLLNVANSIWLNDKYRFQTDFSQANKDYFNAEIKAIDITDPDSPKQINEWVKQATNGKIEDIVEAPLSPALVTLLVNAIYFNGEWTYEFDPTLTKKDAFHTSDEKIQDVPFMTMQEKVPYFENEDFQAVSIPYGEGEMSMNVFLPRNGRQLDEIQKEISNEGWNEWRNNFTDKEGILKLPKFNISYETSLLKALGQLGMQVPFDPQQANFSKMVKGDSQLFISDVIQKTYIDVNEEGTEAAGVTSVEVRETSASTEEPFIMNVNKPFLIAITDNETGIILFMGQIRNPQAGS